MLFLKSYFNFFLMEIQLTYYGVLTELAGRTSENIILEPGSDIAALELQLTQKYPDFGHYPLVFFSDQSICGSDVQLSDKQIVECMPPFAGG